MRRISFCFTLFVSHKQHLLIAVGAENLHLNRLSPMHWWFCAVFVMHHEHKPMATEEYKVCRTTHIYDFTTFVLVHIPIATFMKSSGIFRPNIWTSVEKLWNLNSLHRRWRVTLLWKFHIFQFKRRQSWVAIEHSVYVYFVTTFAPYVHKCESIDTVPASITQRVFYI